MEKGESVVFVDQDGVEHFALVTNVFGGAANVKPSVNLVYVSSDTTKTDTYGRQIERQTSVPHQSQQPAPGFHWKDLAE